jgi:3-phenylpropionate/trans-cinnamate dioxygenase ferredoxin subunit
VKGLVSGWTVVEALEGALAPGSMRAVKAGGLDLALARLSDGTLTAFDLWCTHEECPLADGELEGAHVVCYCHSGEFDVLTGAVIKGPPEDPIRVYPIRSAGDELHVLLEDIQG